MDHPWVGVDVGGARKGFDVAVLDADDRVRLHRAPLVDDVLELAAGARLVAPRPTASRSA